MNQPNSAQGNFFRPSNAQRPAPGNTMNDLDEPTFIDRLFTAMRCNDLEAIHWILDQDDIDLSVKNEHGYTPVHFCLRHCSADVFHALLNCRHDAHVDERDSLGYTPFIAALLLPPAEGRIKMDALVKAKADINLPFVSCDTSLGPGFSASALEKAINFGHAYGVKLLLEAGAQHTYGNDWPLIANAVSHQSYGLVKLLIAAEVDINVSIDIHGEKHALLDIAVTRAVGWKMHESYEIVKMLVLAGAEVNMRAIELAEKNDRIFNCLLEGNTYAKGQKTTLLKAIFDCVVSQAPSWHLIGTKEINIADSKLYQGDFNLFKLFANSIADTEVKKSYISSRLKIAIDKTQYSIMDLLRETGAELYRFPTEEIQTSKKIVFGFSRQIDEETREKILETIKESTPHKTDSTYSPEKSAITNFLTSLDISHHQRTNIYTNKIFTEDNNVLDTVEDKTFFSALISAKNSPSHIETVILGKLTYDDALQNFLENALSIDDQTHLLESAAARGPADSMESSVATEGIDACLIALAPDH